MTAAAAEAAALTRFRSVLVDRFGWSNADTDDDQLARVLRRRAAHHGLHQRDYLRLLGTGEPAGELDTLAEELTITETYFFRHAEQFDALATDVLAERIRLRAAAGQEELRMLSVGCSSGEEPYTLAIVARGVAPGPGWHISVLGVDANPAMLRRAAAARYSSWALRETPADVRRRWFRPRDGLFEVDDRIRADVRFQAYNVVADDPALFGAGRYDAIFCRNLLMYLTPEAAGRLVRRMTDALAPGGGLFLGHTDTLGSRPPGLQPRHRNASTHYRRVRGDDGAPPAPPQPREIAAPPPPPGRGVRERVLDLLRDERFGDAQQLLADEAGPGDELLHAVVLALTGRLDEAERRCREILDADGLSPDAHHLLGVCLEAHGTPDAAVAQYRLAAYLDPAFAMPRLRLGLLARRRGDDAVARTELENARTLLRHETDERILVFGGGFGRLALSTLCRTELDQCGSAR
ncbi:CheR family methyltransferase [Spirilliplanes yamanashiensis]|uniref:Protein-glutamate O-methyltransferase n=1 Tax=Spirilliplanes yamanashiensis TaxID=42233 RepID=A0A8J4DL33_9ACTN|nr:protein-glutamate O-methyltransferase CheR [Spirilliplanes yamanashiensis]MDP9818020.1 chemotaxis protein methyltransferase CheR [Spirilliplanes yamanashiensis]GIJ04829.1 protein-glutamate O-methyltransferase [Spirilliplanes yamanashiensis]